MYVKMYVLTSKMTNFNPNTNPNPRLYVTF